MGKRGKDPARCEPTMTEPTMIERNMAKIKHKILVLSGKGGVGKSTTCCNIAQCFVAQGLKVGVLDIDICGPSVPMLLGLEDREVMQSSDGWVPVFADQEQRLCWHVGRTHLHVGNAPGLQYRWCSDRDHASGSRTC